MPSRKPVMPAVMWGRRCQEGIAHILAGPGGGGPMRLPCCIEQCHSRSSSSCRRWPRLPLFSPRRPPSHRAAYMGGPPAPRSPLLLHAPAAANARSWWSSCTGGAGVPPVRLQPALVQVPISGLSACGARRRWATACGHTAQAAGPAPPHCSPAPSTAHPLKQLVHQPRAHGAGLFCRAPKAAIQRRRRLQRCTST